MRKHVAPALLALLAACGRESTAPITPAPDTTLVPPSVVSWLRANALPLASVDPQDDDRDLRPLDPLLASAQVIGLGEATHGTSEFARLKHRLLRYLVQRHGVRALAVEVPLAEAERVDRYVHTGTGDPAAALVGVDFWMVITEEMLDLVQWLRAYNAAVPAERQLHFVGIDMQYGALPLDSVEAYVRRVDPAAADTIARDYACYEPYLGRLTAPYSAAGDSIHALCQAGVEQAHAWLERHRESYQALSSAGDFERVLHYARLLEQHEDVKRTDDGWLRDRYLAENTAWALDQLPAGSRIALWAHNEHVKATPPSMGAFLRTRYGAGYVAAGFLFWGGSFNVYHQFEKLSVQPAPIPVLVGYESAFHATGQPLLALDLRNSALPPWLAAPHPRRTIGATYMPQYDYNYWPMSTLAADFDLALYVEQMTASHLLPF